MEKLFNFKNKLEFLWWYRLISLQTVIQYSAVYLLYMNKSKMNSTSVNKKESRLLLLCRR
jgi:hypothetical protein